MDQYKEPLFAFIVRMVNNYDIAEDIFQETWIKVIRNVHSFRGDAKFSTWLFQIARNVYRDELRKRKGVIHVSIDETLELPSESDDHAVNMDDMEQAQKIIAGLPVKMKEAIVLRYFHDLHIKEIAEVVGCAEGTIQSRIFRGLDIVRKKRELLYT